MDDYEFWLQRTDVSRLLLCEINYLPAGSDIERTRYISTAWYATEPVNPVLSPDPRPRITSTGEGRITSDGSERVVKGFFKVTTESEPSILYEEAIVGNPYFDTDVTNVIRGKNIVGEIDVENGDGRYDDWILDSYDSRKIRFLHGSPDWGIAEFRVIGEGVINRLEVVDDTKLRFTLQDKLALLNVPLTDEMVSVQDIDGNEVQEPIYKPLAYGTLLNIEPVLIDATARRYKIHDGEVEDVVTQLYVNGKASTAGLTKYNELGEFSLDAYTDGTITIDCKGAIKPNVDPLEPIDNVVDVMNDVIERNGEFSVGELNVPAYNIGIFVKDRTNALSFLDTLLPSNWYYFVNTQGQLQAEVVVPQVEMQGTKIDDLQTSGAINFRISDIPNYRVSLSYRKNWTVQKNIEGITDEDRRVFIEKEYDEVLAEDTGVKTRHPFSISHELVHSFITNESEAQSEVDRIFSVIGRQGSTAKINVSAIGLQFEIGDQVMLYDDRFGLNEGKAFKVYGIRRYLADSQSELSLWRVAE